VTIVALSSLPLEAIVALNNAHAVELSYADAARMRLLIERAYCARGIADTAAMLIAFDQDADYDSENFHWFKARYDRFVYVDRLVVTRTARGSGLAKHLYAHLFDQARADGHAHIGCEVNSDPPNPASDAFHAKCGFAEVGRQTLDAKSKSVRYLLKSLQT
jgi:uncharacterized protein